MNDPNQPEQQPPSFEKQPGPPPGDYPAPPQYPQAPPPPQYPSAGSAQYPQSQSGHPVQVWVQRADHQNRVLALVSLPFFIGRILLALPVAIVLYFVNIAAFVVAWIAMWAILFGGHYPEGMHEFTTGVLRWQTRLNAWVLGLTDSYPGFTTRP